LTTDSGESLVIPLDEAQRLFSSGRAVFLDARGPRDYEEGHILGAKNLPWQAFDEYADRVLEDVAPDAPIIAYCDGENCELSEELTKALVALGYERAKVLVNGWTRWVQAGLPTDKGTKDSGS
jgi:rhodanese-related sulfurtransferase